MVPSIRMGPTMPASTTAVNRDRWRGCGKALLPPARSSPAARNPPWRLRRVRARDRSADACLDRAIGRATMDGEQTRALVRARDLLGPPRDRPPVEQEVLHEDE